MKCPFRGLSKLKGVHNRNTFEVCMTVAAPGGEPRERPPRNPGKFAKDGEQSTPQPAMRIRY